MQVTSFGFGSAGELPLDFDEALNRTKEILARHGFGVQAEIKISEALKAKLGVETPREVILGVCNPALAYRAIQAEPGITVLLPCNVTLRETASGVHIAAANPEALVGLTGNPELAAIASEAGRHLAEALNEI